MTAAIFLDRDGVIVENRSDYIRRWEEVEFIPGALRGLAAARESDFKFVIVTNQSVVGRGLRPLGAIEEINTRIVQTIEESGGRIDGVYICPHAPEDRCRCRKPAPGMLLQAGRDLSLDLARSVIIGDALTDLQAGRAAGLSRLILVRTGRGAQQEIRLRQVPIEGVEVFDSLHRALAKVIPARL